MTENVQRPSNACQIPVQRPSNPVQRGGDFPPYTPLALDANVGRWTSRGAQRGKQP
jgi:hypothetical protein